MFLNSRYFPARDLRRRAKAKFEAPTESFQGKTILITGGTGAICSEAAQIFVGLDVETLVFGVRNLEKGQKLAAQLRKTPGKSPTIHIWRLDMSSFQSVQEFAARSAELPRLDVAIMGAAKCDSNRQMTSDGWEETAQVVHLSSALLSILLLPTLIDSAKRHDTKCLLLNISTGMALHSAAPFVHLPKELNGKDSFMRKVIEAKTISHSLQYGKSKLAHIYFVRELCQQFDTTELQICSLDPGTTRSAISTSYLSSRVLGILAYRELEPCARTVVNACIPREGSHGAFIEDYNVKPYPKYMETEKVREMQAVVWKETVYILSQVSSGAQAFFTRLSQDSVN